MFEEIEKLESPIDAVYLVHKALRDEAVRVEKMVDRLENGASLQPFKLAFNSWATALVYHAEQEERYFKDALKRCRLRSQFESDVGEQTGDSKLRETAQAKEGPSVLPTDIRWAMAAHEEELHQLMEQVEAVLTVLRDDIGPTSLIPRTKQHLYKQVVALRIALEDHLDTEEGLVLPRIRHQMDEQQMLELVAALRIDQRAEDPRWMIDWVSRRLASAEQILLAELEGRCKRLAGAASQSPT